MRDSLIQRLILLGGVIIIGMIATQTYILVKTWDMKDQEFDQTARIMLSQVAQRISNLNGSELPKTGLIQRKSSNYYAVNINTSIDAGILEDYLLQELTNHQMKVDFEYGVYDCHTQDLVYGNYCKSSEEGYNSSISNRTLPKMEELEYYFVVSFPDRSSYLFSNIWLTVLFSLISILAVLFFLYAIWIILKQKKHSELQKDFINNMTHEFKTPLASIKIASEFLSNRAEIQSNDRLSKYISIIKDQNLRLTHQVEKVLNLAKLEKDNFELKKESIKLSPLLQKIVDAENIKTGNDRIVLEIKEDCVIEADRLHLVNVLTNLIDNALKYSTKGSPVYIKLNEKLKNITISIEDHGIGMKKEELEKIFEKFYRVSTGNVHNVKGFGLGLFYVKNICDAHDWDLDVTSEIKKGSTFTISIPRG